jgi:predicted ATP-dependent endonuclease of OLD family
VELGEFTYFVGRNNAGKSHYLKAIETLLSAKAPPEEEIFKLQNNKAQPIMIEGLFEGVENYTNQISKSNHKTAVESSIVGGMLRVVRTLHSAEDQENEFGVRDPLSGLIVNPSGFVGNLLRVLPEAITIVATADTVEELKSKSNTAISKLKKEVLGPFLEQLKGVTKDAFKSVDDFLHSQEEGIRSSELVRFESELKSELVGEFSEVIPSVEFTLPDEDIIAQEMKLLLDDGHVSEVDQKGHGLQRATLLALLRLLAKQGGRYRDRPAPLFLIGELETFLHPFAQKQLGATLSELADRYQVLTTTHSPFIIAPGTITGYRRVVKTDTGTRNVRPDWTDIDVEAIKRHLEWRGNLEGLFADRVILTEGGSDEVFYERLLKIFNINRPPGRFTLFVKMNGSKGIQHIREFYSRIGMEDVAAIIDLDCTFSNKLKPFVSSLGMDSSVIDALRNHIGLNDDRDPRLEQVVNLIAQNGEPPQLEGFLDALAEKRIFVLRRGGPEHYSVAFPGQKLMLPLIDSMEDLREPEYLASLLRRAVQGDPPASESTA